MKCVILDGELPFDIKANLEGINTTALKAEAAHLVVMEVFRKYGWQVIPEFPVDGGIIDIIATHQGQRVGIEVDRKTPRQKSIRKLNGMDADCKVVVLRG